ncbi:tRNA (guanine(26)-N(2))-dimethyltransferase 2-like isoform X2 [Typha angustifolia]|uniref:tRNA (guanine(26)-N(2))-dimethyltransferase 2-like isoform X2 n=1 Tax=Typha angustifolia TaxID=59011 RepID=UPI003C2F67EB
MRFAIRAAPPLHLWRKSSRLNLSVSISFVSSSAQFDTGDVGEMLGGHSIIKEGEVEILMNSTNSVFYNKAQDLHSIEHEKPDGDCEMKLNQCLEESSPMLEGSHDVSLRPEGKIKAPRVLEALAASGLRALRYACEVDGIGEVVALDNDEVAIEACKKNIQLNGSLVSSKVVAHVADARVYMLTHPKEFDVVDLDPYGSPAAFLDSAVQTVADGGLLMCSATDMAVLAGGNGGVCFSKYGSYPLKGKYCHEMALRILLACIESHANRYKRYIVPILSIQMDFYVRVFVRIFTFVSCRLMTYMTVPLKEKDIFFLAAHDVHFLIYIYVLFSLYNYISGAGGFICSSASAMKRSPLKLSYVYQCVGCDSFYLQNVGRTVSKGHKNNSERYAPGLGPAVPQECSDCGKKFNMGGPIWSAPIHDQEWVASILSSVEAMKDRYPAYERISAVLTAVSEELPDAPLFVSLHNLCATLKCACPTIAMLRSAVINAGYRISGTHVNPLGLKSDAPMNVIWDIMRCWVKIHPVKSREANQSGSVILSKEPIVQANFSEAVERLRKRQAKKAPRFLPNPEKNWGPKSKAGRQVKSNHQPVVGPHNLNELA